MVFLTPTECDPVHNSRDKILLEGEQPSDDSDGDEEEVFALNGIASSSDEGADEADDDVGEDDVETDKRKKKNTPAKSRKRATKPPSTDSGEESAAEGEETWGNKKSSYYSSNAAQLDSDDDEAHDMDEQEAIRLQAKLREGLSDADFGYLDALQHASEAEEHESVDPFSALISPHSVTCSATSGPHRSPLPRLPLWRTSMPPSDACRHQIRRP